MDVITHIGLAGMFAQFELGIKIVLNARAVIHMSNRAQLWNGRNLSAEWIIQPISNLLLSKPIINLKLLRTSRFNFSKFFHPIVSVI